MSFDNEKVDNNVDQTSEVLSWEGFFEQRDRALPDDQIEDGIGSLKIHSSVSTLPYKKAICYGVCTVSETPKLVKCEDCGLAIKMVGFGHHRKLRHKDYLTTVARQTPEMNVSTDSDSEDDCHGFLLSPPNYHMSQASTSEEGLQRDIQDDDLPINTLDFEFKSNMIYEPTGGIRRVSTLKSPYYDVVERKDLRLVLKRTPDKSSLEPTSLSTLANEGHHPKEKSAAPRKVKKPPLVRVFGSKKKRKGGKGKKTATTKIQTHSDEHTAINQYEQVQFPSIYHANDFNKNIKCPQINIKYAKEQSPDILFPMTQPSLSSESMVHWDPRNDAERPNMLRGKASKSVVSTILSNRKSAQRGTITSFMGVKIENELKRETSLDKVAVPGPSVLKRQGIPLDKRRPFEQQYRQNKQLHQPHFHGNPIIQQIFKHPGISITTSNTGEIGPTATSLPITTPSSTVTNKIASQSNINNMHIQQNPTLQQQLAAMQQQQQRRRMLTRDFDAFAKRQLFEEISPDSHRSQEMPKPSRIPSNRTAIVTPNQTSPSDSPTNSNCSSSKSETLLPRIPINSDKQIQPQLERERSMLTKSEFTSQSHFNGQPAQSHINWQKSNERNTNHIDSLDTQNNSNITWRKLDSLSSPHKQHLQLQRRKSSISSTATTSEQQLQSGSNSGATTRFIPVDPRGLTLATLKKNSSTPTLLSKSHSASNSPIHPNNSNQIFSSSNIKNEVVIPYSSPSPLSLSTHQKNTDSICKKEASIAKTNWRKRNYDEIQQQQQLPYDSKHFHQIAPKQHIDQKAVQVQTNRSNIGESIVPRQHQQPILHQYFKQNQQQSMLHTQSHIPVPYNSNQQQQQTQYHNHNMREQPIQTQIFNVMQQQLSHQPIIHNREQNGIIRTITVNPAQLTNNSGRSMAMHSTNYNNCSPTAFQSTSLQACVYPNESVSEECIIGSSPPPADYLASEYGQVPYAYEFNRQQQPYFHHQPISHYNVGPMIPMSYPSSTGPTIRRFQYHTQQNHMQNRYMHPHAVQQYHQAQAHQQQQRLQFLQSQTIAPTSMDWSHNQLLKSRQQDSTIIVRNANESTDSLATDPPPVLVAEVGYPPSTATEQTKTNKSIIPNTSTATTSNMVINNGSSPNTRSSSASASDIDLREMLQQPTTAATIMEPFIGGNTSSTTTIIGSRQLKLGQNF